MRGTHLQCSVIATKIGPDVIVRDGIIYDYRRLRQRAHLVSLLCIHRKGLSEHRHLQKLRHSPAVWIQITFGTWIMPTDLTADLKTTLAKAVS
ncbi:hypothetical protein NS277_12700 [Novosphingobium barchaimii]|nr:hypothetical protein NS277_12700 [Novosphingobium barchaimii]